MKKDYYKIASYILSCDKITQFKMCERFIELFAEKHNHKMELTFSGINKFHYVNRLKRELYEYIKVSRKRLLYSDKIKF